MILYVDSSALAKAYVDEPGTDAMLATLRRAPTVMASVLVWSEVLAMLARRQREGHLSHDAHAALRARFHEDYQDLVVVEVDGRVLELTDRLVVDHPLRSADAVHLASALFIAESGEKPVFACSDRALLAAARAERLDVFDPSA